MNPLKSTDWLAENIDKVKILDATWHLPNSNRNALKEYEHGHIENSIFFDLDKNSNQDVLPTYASRKTRGKTVSSLGIQNDDQIIIYDNLMYSVLAGVGLHLFILVMILI